MSSLKTIGLVCLIGLALFLGVRPSAEAVSAKPSVALTQGPSCPSIVTTALDAIDQKCAAIGRNSACYGSNQLSVAPQPGVTDFNFQQPGDVARVDAIRVLKLAPLDASTNTWGSVVLRVQANLPDSAPGQNVTMLLFGDVEMTDDSAEANSATPPATVSAPPASTPNAPAAYKTMQAFYFRSGVGEPACKEAPPDGILIQSPKGTTKVDLQVDGVQVSLGSTVFIRAGNNEFVLDTLEGSATVTALGVTLVVPAGSEIHIPLTPQLRPAGPPGALTAYNAQALAALPVSHLPDRITMAVPGVPTPAATAAAAASGPYVVKQSIGGATLNGNVCSLTKPFSVSVSARTVTFAFNFVPTDATQGTWSYAYSFPSAGETHDASGTYTIGAPDKDGSLPLSMTGKDQVKFKGVNQPFPIQYTFKLVPSKDVACP